MIIDTVNSRSAAWCGNMGLMCAIRLWYVRPLGTVWVCGARVTGFGGGCPSFTRTLPLFELSEFSFVLGFSCCSFTGAESGAQVCLCLCV